LRFLLRLSALIDALNTRVGHAVYWLILLAVIISSANATIRYTLDTSSNAWLEVQWYLFSAVFLLCAGYTLLRNEHVRIDILSARFSRRTQAWIDLIGNLLFLLPMAIIIMWLSWPMVEDSYVRHEISGHAGGLLRWPVKILIPIGFFLLILQGVSEMIKRGAYLLGLIAEPMEMHHDVHSAPSSGAPE
jgi:TRAP-type mannitol/chloroaromatic compound transport system permease small subunit